MTEVSRVARSHRRTCFRTPTAHDRLLEPGWPVSRRHARFEALLPPRVRSRGSTTLAGVDSAWSVLSWDSSPLELTPSIPRVRLCCRGPPEKGPSPFSMGLQRSSHLASNARSVSRPWFLGSRIHRPARSIEPCRPPSGSDPANEAFHERLERQSPAAHANVSSVLPAPPSGGAPHLPRSLSAVPRRSERAEPRRCLLEVSSVDSSLAMSFEASRLLWSFAPHRDALGFELASARA